MHHNDGRTQSGNSSSKRGSVNNRSRLEAFTNRTKKGSAEWGSCDAILIQEVITGITALGGAVTFGLSRNDGAHSLTLLLDDSRETMWFNGDATLDEELDAVLQTIAAIT